ncbi:MAG: hypothetical protein K8U57_15345 [Planctomycetes bacterium]|nr:hypothetical protein [Planctomycetota bacterium]
MLLAPRKLAFLVFASLAVVVSGCGSNNSGKINGKWKLVSAPGFDEQAKMMEAFKAYVYFEFKEDGTVTVGAGFTDPTMQEMIAKSGEKTSMSGKYKLLNGDDVEFSGLNDPKKGGGLFGKGDQSRLKIQIDGDNMTITGTDGTGKLTRLKADAAPAETPKVVETPKPGNPPKKK